MHGENAVLMSRSINILIDSGGKNSACFYRRKGSSFWLFSSWSLIGHALRPIFMLWLLKIWQVSSRGKFMRYLETCLVIAEADSFVSFYSCTKWKTAAIKILLLFMAGLFIGSFWLFLFIGSFWLRNAPLFRVIGNPFSDGIVFKMSLYLTLLDA